MLLVWAGMLFYNNHSLADIYTAGWPMAVTMVVGAFIAGATAEGGGAIAFPVMTLLLNIVPAEARVFSLGCQSFGMTSASAMILSRQIPVVKRCIVPVCTTGIMGFMISDEWIVPVLAPAITKLFFVSLWLSFGLALWMINRRESTIKNVGLPENLRWNHYALLLAFGLVGGAVSALFGNGIDIVTFTLLTLFFRVDEKIATPTSVILMSVITVFGFTWHWLVRHDVSQNVTYYLLAAIPVCIAMAPLGAFIISKLSRGFITAFLYAVIVAQFITAIWVIGPGRNQLLFMFSVFVSGSLFFYILARNHSIKS